MVSENGKTANGTAPAGSAAGPSRQKSNDVDDDDAAGGGTGDDARQTVLEQNGYRVLRTLGHGSYATVKSAYSDRHQTNVAIKIISKRRAPADYIEKFLPREINIVKILKHQNLVTFLQVCPLRYTRNWFDHKGIRTPPP
jgi:serine/threonine protein kinase